MVDWELSRPSSTSSQLHTVWEKGLARTLQKTCCEVQTLTNSSVCFFRFAYSAEVADTVHREAAMSQVRRIGPRQ
jgi:hypothetical protein